MEKFREKIVKTADKALGWVNEYLEDKVNDLNKINNAIKVVQLGVKMEHMNQLKEQNKKSLAIRLLKFLPDKETRMEYIKLTNPEIKPLLLKKPEIKKQV